MSRNISVLGSTGSIGTQTLKIIENLGDRVAALAAHKNIALLEEQIRKYKPVLAAVMEEAAAVDLKTRVADTSTKIVGGMEGFCACAVLESADIVVNSVVGMVGLQPTLEAIRAKKRVALANKETLVAGGKLVMKAAKDQGISILPIDSEHSAILQSIEGCQNPREIKKLILTASGGPFFGKTFDELKTVTPEQALRHPNWKMGAKISIDCATMMNKGLELIEAVWLFNMPPESIEVVIHRESVIHSMVEYRDHSVIAQLGVPDMCIPIQYALTYPNRYPAPVNALSLARYGKLTFFEPDAEAFPALGICREAIERGGLHPAAMNGANEQAVALFLERKIRFTDICRLAYDAMQEVKNKENVSLSDILAADQAAREYVLSHI